MGFRLNRTYKLRWDTGDLAGLEVDCGPARVKDAEEFREVTGARELAAFLAERIKRWNLEGDDGQEVELDVDAICHHLEEVVLAEIGKAWYEAAVGVSAPLDLGSISGEPSPEEPIIETEAL